MEKLGMKLSRKDVMEEERLKERIKSIKEIKEKIKNHDNEFNDMQKELIKESIDYYRTVCEKNLHQIQNIDTERNFIEEEKLNKKLKVINEIISNNYAFSDLQVSLLFEALEYNEFMNETALRKIENDLDILGKKI